MPSRPAGETSTSAGTLTQHSAANLHGDGEARARRPFPSELLQWRARRNRSSCAIRVRSPRDAPRAGMAAATSRKRSAFDAWRLALQGWGQSNGLADMVDEQSAASSFLKGDRPRPTSLPCPPCQQRRASRERRVTPGHAPSKAARPNRRAVFSGNPLGRWQWLTWSAQELARRAASGMTEPDPNRFDHFTLPLGRGAGGRFQRVRRM